MHGTPHSAPISPPILTDGGCATGDGRLRTLVEVIHRYGTTELELEVCMRIDTTRNDELTGGIDRAASTGHHEIRTGTNIPARIGESNTEDALD